MHRLPGTGKEAGGWSTVLLKEGREKVLTAVRQRESSAVQLSSWSMEHRELAGPARL